MKILIDLQALQTRSRLRGIGRYTRDLLRALVRTWPEAYELHVALSSPLDEAVDEVIADLRTLLPRENIHYLRLLRDTSAEGGMNAWRAQASAHVMRHATDLLRPDVVWHSSVMEGRREDAIVPAVKTGGYTTISTLYDLLPLHDPRNLLAAPGAEAWYSQRLDFLRASDRLFAISGWTKNDAMTRLGLDATRIVNIGCGVDPVFRPLVVVEPDRSRLLSEHGISGPFVFYNGGYDARKNVESLVAAFEMLPAPLRSRYTLVLAGDVPEASRRRWSRRLGVESIHFPGYVSDEMLVRLYSLCSLFVFPSSMEGFGLPPLEAMACGAPVICSNATSLPDVVGRKDVLFSPFDTRQLAERMQAVLGNAALSEELRQHNLQRACLFSWDAVAVHAIDALREIGPTRNPTISLAAGDLRDSTTIPSAKRPGLLVRIASTHAPVWLDGLGAYYDVVRSAPPAADQTQQLSAEHAHTRVLYVADVAHADELASQIRRVPGVVMLMRDSDKPHAARAFGAEQYLRYIANGYAGMVSSPLRDETGDAAVWNGLLEGCVGLLVEHADLFERIRRSLPDVAMPPQGTIEGENPAAQCRQYIEDWYARSTLARESALMRQLSDLPGQPSDDDLAQTAFAIMAARTPLPPIRWLIDVTSVANENLGTGVARVVTNILAQWLRTPPSGIRIEPVRFAEGQFRFAHRQALELLGMEVLDEWPAADIVHARPGDVFVGLDWSPESLDAARPLLEDWRRSGMRCHFIANDLLPLKMPQFFHAYSRTLFEQWARNITWLADMVHCISHATARDLEDWMDSARPPHQFGVRPSIGQFDLGADFPRHARGTPVRRPLETVLGLRPTFLMVGTLEPRKGHARALDAVESLWRQDIEVNLVIAGHRGWMVDALIARLERHPERDRRLFWFEDVEDAELVELYSRSTALLAASEGEGYGLPLIEAAQHGLPVIARALPVFREVMGEMAHYLEMDPVHWPAQLQQWLASPPERRSHDQWSTWSQAAQSLASAILRDALG